MQAATTATTATGAASSSSAAPASSSAAAAAPAPQPRPYMRFKPREAPEQPPESYFSIVSRDFVLYCNQLSLYMGRSTSVQAGDVIPKSDPATLSLGADKQVSRQHLEIRWSRAQRRWELRAMGKNGVWSEGVKYEAGEFDEAHPEREPTLVLSSRKATPLRIGLGDDACMFYFCPALVPRAPRAPTSPSKADGGKEGGAQSAAKAKRKAVPGASSGGGAADGGAVADDDLPLSKKKRKKLQELASVDASSAVHGAGASPVDLTRPGGTPQPQPQPIAVDEDEDDFMPLDQLLLPKDKPTS